jgi:hypothetical protein
VQFQLEIDVAALESTSNPWETAVAVESATEATWSPPAPTAVIDVPAWNDVVAVEIYAPVRPRRLAGAIEIVSPSNKDRPESREAFVAKCERYLQTELGLLIVDIVTERKADLHHALLTRLDAEDSTDHPGQLFACAYAPQRLGERLQLRLWHTLLNLGSELPTLPLHLHEGPVIAIDLESTYTEACRALRIPV